MTALLAPTALAQPARATRSPARSPDLVPDGVVDSLDLARLLNSFGLPAAESPDAARADLNNDGAVGKPDLALLLARMGDAAHEPRCWRYCDVQDRWLDCAEPCAEVAAILRGGGEGCVDFEICEDGSIVPCGACGSGGGGDGTGVVGDGDPGGTGGGGNNNPPPPPPPCAFTINNGVGVNYIGVFGSASMVVVPDDGAAAIESVTWTIDSGQGRLASSTPFTFDGPENNILSIVSNGAPGDVTATATATTTDGDTCSASHTVTMLQYDEINIRYQAFIECPAVQSPTGLFAGDGRSFAYSGAYRARFDVDLRTSDFAVGPDMQVLQTNGAPFGMSAKFPASSIQDTGVSPCPLVILGPPDKTAVQVATLGNHKIEYIRGAANRGLVRFFLAAENPLSPPLITWEIDACITIGIEQKVDPETGQQTALYEITAGHDEFPAHELYLNGAPVSALPINSVDNLPTGIVNGLSLYSPIVAGVSPFRLCFGLLELQVQWRAQGQLLTSSP